MYETDFKDAYFWMAAANIVFNPLFWNIVARWEYRTKGFSKAIGSSRVACIMLAVTIVLLGILRDWLFGKAVQAQPRWLPFQDSRILLAGYAIISIGCVLVISSFLSLGIFGTFLGDYFGILMKERVTGFPFNIVDNPMYLGATLNFLGYAVTEASLVGFLLTFLVGVVYKIAILFEGDFTDKIYQERVQMSRKEV
ncbi:phosphatidylethanolamine N-methyltransferase isoform X2 [Patella vulgata]|nr:phosphatidylethanolamine N-methyltransferase isoform X2 [Patella vulgata]